MFPYVVLGLAFLVVVGLTLSIYTWLLERRQQAYLRSLEAEAPVRSSSSQMLLGPLTPLIASQSPIRTGKVPVLEQELREAGFYHRNALVEYQAIRAILTLLPLLGLGGLAVAADPAEIPSLAGAAAVFAILGFSLPRVYLRMIARSRSREIERGLPVAVDLMNLGLSGGQNIYASLTMVSRELKQPFPVLADELRIVREQAELGHLSHALQQFADRTNVNDVRSLAFLLSQNDQLGTDVSTSLLEYASHLRTGMRQRAEARANRANFWMLFPTILCLWVPAVLVLFGPIYSEFTKGRDRFRDISNTSKLGMQKARPLQETTNARSSGQR